MITRCGSKEIHYYGRSIDPGRSARLCSRLAEVVSVACHSDGTACLFVNHESVCYQARSSDIGALSEAYRDKPASQAGIVVVPAGRIRA